MRNAASLFLGQFWRAPRSVGAALPSSRGLAEAMMAPIDFATAQAVVEFGPGTGALTRAVAARLRPGTKYLGIELNEAFCRRLKAEFPDLDFAQASVENLGALLDARGIETVDAIVCGLPWASLPSAIQGRVFGEMDQRLAPGGVFVTFAYLQGLALPGARALRARLRQHFAQVSRTRIVWRNVPPAFAYVCRK